MSHLLLLSVHRLRGGRSGEAVHLRQLAQALAAAGERVTVLDGPLQPGRPVADPGAALRRLHADLDRLLDADRPAAALLWPGARGEETRLARRLAEAGVRLVLEHPAADLPPDPDTVAYAADVVVPSRFARRHFAAATGRWAHAVEPLLRPCDCPADRLPAVGAVPFRVTFVNPEPAKGLGVVLTLAQASAAHRLPLRFRFVEGRWTAADLRRIGVDPTRIPHLEVVPFQEDVCGLYARTDLLLAPSLWRESFGMVAREATVHGVPVVATRVGGLPEAVGSGGICLDAPPCGPHYGVTLTGAQVRQWLAAMVAALRGGHRAPAGLRADSAAATVTAYRELLLGPAAAGTGRSAQP
ncbi:glycosyltransferase [Micromonospora sp. NPDC047074]|uniref:glycosyltransferase n=1 Tax=Micromonospora sp. NPDC047074 TaxID=3154339 RepID=UPI0033FBF314